MLSASFVMCGAKSDLSVWQIDKTELLRLCNQLFTRVLKWWSFVLSVVDAIVVSTSVTSESCSSWFSVVVEREPGVVVELGLI